MLLYIVILPLLLFIPDTQATEFTSTTKAWPSLLMSFLGDLVPYFHTTANEEEKDDKTAATLVYGDGGEIEPRDTGSQAGYTRGLEDDLDICWGKTQNWVG